MGLETGVTYIEDLDATNPATGDGVTQGDDHLRNIKTAIQGSFPSLGAAPVTVTAAQLNDSVNRLTSFEGRTNAAAVLQADDYPINWLRDTFIGSPTAEQSLVFNGTDWVNQYLDKHVASFTTTGSATQGEFDAIPDNSLSNAPKKITLLMKGIQLSSTSARLGIQIGDDNTYTQTSAGGWLFLDGFSNPSALQGTVWTANVGAQIFTPKAAARIAHGIVELMRLDGTQTWMVRSQMTTETMGNGGQQGGTYVSNGFITAADYIDRIKVTTSTGTFSAGQTDVRISQ